MRTISNNELSSIVGSDAGDLMTSAFIFSATALITYCVLEAFRNEVEKKTPEQQFDIINKKISDLEKALAK